MYVDVFCHFDAARLISAMDKQMDGCSDKHRAPRHVLRCMHVRRAAKITLCIG